MTEDEQEALSCKYVMPRVMRLTSGRFALLQGDELRIYEAGTLIAALPSYDELPEATRPTAKPRRKATLNLADLGL